MQGMHSTMSYSSYRGHPNLMARSRRILTSGHPWSVLTCLSSYQCFQSQSLPNMDVPQRPSVLSLRKPRLTFLRNALVVSLSEAASCLGKIHLNPALAFVRLFTLKNLPLPSPSAACLESTRCSPKCAVTFSNISSAL